MKFHIIMAMYNNESNIADCIHSMQAQTHFNFRCIVIDDLSDDRSVAVAHKTIDGDDRFTLIVNSTKKHKTRNVFEGIDAAGAAPEDVIVMVDGDDRLGHSRVLETVADTYRNTDCWMTYGSYSDSHGDRDPICREYEQFVIDTNCFRHVKWRASHLKTFKYHLWRSVHWLEFRITDAEIHRARTRALLRGRMRTWFHWRGIRSADLNDVSGRYMRRCDDKAFSYPMLEMSGNKAVLIEDVLYVYGSQPSTVESAEPIYGNGNSEKWHTRLIRDVIVNRPAYPRRSDPLPEKTMLSKAPWLRRNPSSRGLDAV